MTTQLTIAIIGATGETGRALSICLSGSAHRLLLLADDSAKLNDLLQEINIAGAADAEAIHCTVNACWEADIIIMAIPFSEEKMIADKIKQVSTGKIVISLCNSSDHRSSGTTLSDETSVAEQLQSLMPNSKVVTAFNTISASDFLQPFKERKTTDVLIAGDDRESVNTIFALAASVGFQPVKAGGLTISRVLENMHTVSTL